ncbi:MAG: hypothetical protein DHS20C03_28410 [Minwuia thermotolerans]|nr:MAG: hypothetical protein DHS20C03_28410 [Minwuia thermotolerans]
MTLCVRESSQAADRPEMPDPMMAMLRPVLEAECMCFLPKGVSRFTASRCPIAGHRFVTLGYVA